MAMPSEIYATFAGPINQEALGRIYRNFGLASQGGAKQVHILFQSLGGTVGDGISLYNFFRTVPIDLHLYNTGAVQSIGMVAYLGAKHRYTSTYANFLVHKAYGQAQGLSASRLSAMANALVDEDARIEAIIKAHTTIPQDKWDLHAYQDVIISAADAVQYGIAQHIREFTVPTGSPIFDISL